MRTLLLAGAVGVVLAGTLALRAYGIPVAQFVADAGAFAALLGGLWAGAKKLSQ